MGIFTTRWKMKEILARAGYLHIQESYYYYYYYQVCHNSVTHLKTQYVCVCYVCVGDRGRKKVNN